jgi:IS30 family transposase
MESNKSAYMRFTSCERARIEEMINEGARLSDIAFALGKNPTSVSREVKRNRVELRRVSTSKFMRNPCAHRETCTKTNLCRARGCTKPCSRCERVFCHERCADFSAWECARTRRWPFVCNRCAQRSTCPERRWVYEGARAQRIASSRASLSRQGLGIDAAEVERIDEIVSPLLSRGQSPYHIWNNHRDELGVCLSTLYAYINAGILSVGRMSLTRAVRTRRRKENREIRDKRDFAMRTYADYLVVMEAIFDEA